MKKKCLVNESFVPATQRIILKIVGFKDSNADLGVIFRFLQNSPITKAVCTKISKIFFFAFLAIF